MPERARQPGGFGHRSVPHTADLCVEAWAATREECICEAVRGVVGSFATFCPGAETAARECELVADSDEQLLAAVLDEVVYRLDAHREIPADLAVLPLDRGVGVRFTMVDAAQAVQIGAVPKAVSLHGLELGRRADGWVCRVVLDV